MSKDKGLALLGLSHYPQRSNYVDRCRQYPPIAAMASVTSSTSSKLSASSKDARSYGFPEVQSNSMGSFDENANPNEGNNIGNEGASAHGHGHEHSVIVSTTSVAALHGEELRANSYGSRELPVSKIEPMNEDDPQTDTHDMANHLLLSSGSGTQICRICGDRATGKHYGAYSCDGCKGFFRRSVRKAQNYSCRFNWNCVITKDKRNQCRCCRFRKCISAGMKKEAVQNERDRISQQRPTFDDPNCIISLPMLLQAEDLFRQFRRYPPNTDAEVLNRMKVAGVDEVCDSMKEQLIALVNWAQTIPAFMKFNQSDKVALLRARAGEHLLLGAAWRSIGVDDVLLLGNDCIIPKDASEREINRIGRRVMNELVKTFRETRMDENEFVCLKAIVFFDPSIKGLGVNAVKKVKDIRYRVQLILEDYIKNRNIESRGRFGLLLLSLQVLQSIAWQMVEQIQFAELFGGAKVDKLLAEMLLGEVLDSDDCDEESKDCPFDPVPVQNYAPIEYQKGPPTYLPMVPSPSNIKEDAQMGVMESPTHPMNLTQNENEYLEKYFKQEIIDASDV